MKTLLLIIIPIILFFVILTVIVFGFTNNAEPEPQAQSDSCPEGIDFIYASRRITSCGANPPQTEFSILKTDGINKCQINQEQHYYMNAGNNASVTYSYEITENKQNPNKLFDLDNDTHFMCKIENGGYKTCTPHGMHVNYELGTKHITELPIIKECIVLRKNQKNIEAYKNEMQKALDLAFKNNTTHIKKLSETI
ncbi:hypothetical protein [Nitrosopumilus ureiphilus]|uniref:Uncharacterized protein n=1 Tax=Nitrosopumilus ureiphilus TaxID=1470067 RepID=A0A7D5R245_9ARCH|nr:hypothetical protein [Nitrosopumilus ureiphilus]QLH07136.1 hypothetical protein C5F50_08660 [Nitrosopumilus ureiphilus]